MVGNKNLYLGLLERLKNNKLNETITYVSSYYFVVLIDDKYYFYYTPKLFWCEVASSELNESILLKIKEESAVFFNYDPDLNYSFQESNSFANIKIPQNPDIGNIFYSMGNQIITYQGYFSFFGSFGKTYVKSIKNLSSHELRTVLYFSSITNTNKYLKDINDILKYK